METTPVSDWAGLLPYYNTPKKRYKVSTYFLYQISVYCNTVAALALSAERRKSAEDLSTERRKSAEDLSAERRKSAEALSEALIDERQQSAETVAALQAVIEQQAKEIMQGLSNIKEDDLRMQDDVFVTEYLRLCQLYAVSPLVVNDPQIFDSNN